MNGTVTHDPPSKTIIYYYHIPKCGGLFVKDLLQRYASQCTGHFVSFTDLTSKQQFDSNEKKLFSFINQILSRDEQYIFIHHHHRFSGVDKLYPIIQNIRQLAVQDGHKFFMFTVIRQPLSFHISRLNYLLNTGDGADNSFHSYLKNEAAHNFISKYLLYNHPSMWIGRQSQLVLTKKHLVDRIQIFDQIFLQDKMHELLTFLSSYIGIANVSISKNINVGEHKILPSPEEEEEVMKCSELDHYLYEVVRTAVWKASGSNL